MSDSKNAVSLFSALLELVIKTQMLPVSRGKGVGWYLWGKKKKAVTRILLQATIIPMFMYNGDGLLILDFLSAENVKKAYPCPHTIWNDDCKLADYRAEGLFS